jgi:anti-sigma factor RsiW
MTEHLEDGALVRHLDDQAPAPERAAAAEHLRGCDRCARRMGELARAADVLSSALRAAETSDLHGRPRRRWGLRVAAALLILVGVGGTVRPVRAWIVNRAVLWWNGVTGAEGTPRIPPPPRPSRSASVAFVPVGSEFTLEVTAWQREGTLRIETVVGDTATATMQGGSGAEDLVVLPTALRIMGGPTSTASYVIRVPERLRRVHVRVGDAPPWDYHPGEGPREAALDGAGMSEEDHPTRSRNGSDS